MKRTLATLALVVAAGAAAGCGENPQSITIVGFGPITTDTTSKACVTPLPTTLNFVSFGVYDTAIPAAYGYLMAPVVQNNLPTTASTVSVERSAYVVTGYEMQLLRTKGKFTSPSLVTLSKVHTVALAPLIVYPGGQTARGSFTIEAFPESAAADLGSELAAGWDGNMVVRGRMVGTVANSVMKSATVDFPIQVCQGCLLQLGFPITDCPGGGVPSMMVRPGFGCNPAQDAPITCCKSGGVLCGSDVPTKT